MFFLYLKIYVAIDTSKAERTFLLRGSSFLLVPMGNNDPMLGDLLLLICSADGKSPLLGDPKNIIAYMDDKDPLLGYPT